VNKFSDILLRDYHKSKGCKKDGVYTKQYSASLKNKLFGDYANHIKDMMNNTAENQDKLVAILETLFASAINPQTKRKEIIINPKITEALLQSLVEKARASIVEMYVKCESDFVKGLELFEAIVEKQIKDTSEAQIANLQATLQDSIAESPINQYGAVEDNSEDQPTESRLEHADGLDVEYAMDAAQAEIPSEMNATHITPPVVAEASASKEYNAQYDDGSLAKSKQAEQQHNLVFMPTVYVPNKENLIQHPLEDSDDDE
jgi:hypothetical protein